ncbi:MAG TPA: alpha/beta hydrolase [Methylocella sp.]|nr:alpha/beta hydrolase [Methylocella sp.]
MHGNLRFSHWTTNGVTLHCAEAGPEDGRLVILLHGFPEFWFGWRYQIGELANAGYRVVAPDQRGYNKSTKPAGKAAYAIDILAADVIGLADALGCGSFALIGHDWGGVVGWWIASHYPDRIERFAALNAPHPFAWMDAVRNNPVQRKMSRYIGFFQMPWLPEFVLRRDHFKALTEAFRQSRRPGAFTDADLAQYRAAWSEPGALTAMLNWYRKPITAVSQPPIAVPVLVVWGMRDAYLVPELADASAKLCARASVTSLEEATHWVQYDATERVNARLLEFLK